MSILMLAVQCMSAVLEACMGYLFLGVLSEKCREKFAEHKIYIGFWVLFTGVQIVYNKKISFFSSAFLVTVILLTWISVVLILRDNKWVHLLLVCIFNSILALLDFLGAFGVVWLSRGKITYWEFLFNSTELKSVIVLSIRLAFAVFIFGAGVFIRKNHIEIQLESKKLFIITGIGMGGILYLQWIFVDERMVMSISVWVFLLFVIIVLFVLSTLILAYMKAKQKEQMISIRNEFLEHNYTEMHELYRLNAEQFHDFKNHLNVIYEYCKEEKWNRVTEYVEGIRTPMASLDRRVWSGNEVMDLILNYKKAEAANADIQCDIETEKMNLRHISDQDLCTVLSNIMDNAIEACRKMTMGKPWIKVIIRSKGNILVVKINNSIAAKPIEKNGKLVTSKEKKGLHGLGLASVSAVVEKYEGVMKYRYDDKEFEVSITMYD